jgi:hypothetical protein
MLFFCPALRLAAHIGSRALGHGIFVEDIRYQNFRYVTIYVCSTATANRLTPVQTLLGSQILVDQLSSNICITRSYWMDRCSARLVRQVL